MAKIKKFWLRKNKGRGACEARRERRKLCRELTEMSVIDTDPSLVLSTMSRRSPMRKFEKKPRMVQARLVEFIENNKRITKRLRSRVNKLWVFPSESFEGRGGGIPKSGVEVLEDRWIREIRESKGLWISFEKFIRIRLEKRQALCDKKRFDSTVGGAIVREAEEALPSLETRRRDQARGGYIYDLSGQKKKVSASTSKVVSVRTDLSEICPRSKLPVPVCSVQWPYCGHSYD